MTPWRTQPQAGLQVTTLSRAKLEVPLQMRHLLRVPLLTDSPSRPRLRVLPPRGVPVPQLRAVSQADLRAVSRVDLRVVQLRPVLRVQPQAQDGQARAVGVLRGRSY